MQILCYKTKEDAKAVLNLLQEQIAREGLVSLEDYYYASGIDGSFNDTRMGWKRLKRIRVYQRKDGFWTIALPAPAYFN